MLKQLKELFESIINSFAWEN